ncbi:MAG TPA: hypothetical protein VFA33_30195 [Bryobacteraceae bacterium]|nr:hypothetical protein [Bryobacteraceae bacterium]
MNSNQRPLPVTIVGYVYILVGAAGFAYHFRAMLASRSGSVWVELTELVALVCGVFILRGNNCARWAALAWIAFHVILSAFHSFRQFAIHAVICAVIAWVLFGPGGARYFRGGRSGPA